MSMSNLPAVPDVACPCGNGLRFAACHGGTTPAALVASGQPAVAPLPPELVAPIAPPLARAVPTLKLDLACGQSPIDGFEGVDLWEGAQHRWNLLEYPWPVNDSSVAELHCSHFIEHIPMWFVDKFGNPIEGPKGMLEGQDALLRFFDECYRVLMPGGTLRVIWPSMRSNRAFQDPTHRRFPTEETIAMYLNAEWRAINRLDHYKAECDFTGFVGQSYDISINTRHPQVQRDMIHNSWNHTVDFMGTLTARKPAWQPAGVVPAQPAG